MKLPVSFPMSDIFVNIIKNFSTNLNNRWAGAKIHQKKHSFSLEILLCTSYASRVYVFKNYNPGWGRGWKVGHEKAAIFIFIFHTCNPKCIFILVTQNLFTFPETSFICSNSANKTLSFFLEENDFQKRRKWFFRKKFKKIQIIHNRDFIEEPPTKNS